MMGAIKPPYIEEGNEKCGTPGCVNSEQEQHCCPYRAEIHGDFIFKCNCCKDCERRCVEDI